MLIYIIFGLMGFYAWHKNLFEIRYKKDPVTEAEIEEYFEQTTVQERIDAVESYQNAITESHQEAQRRIYDTSIPISQALNMLALSSTIYPEYPSRIASDILDNPTKRAALKRHFESIIAQHNPPASVSSIPSKYKIGDKIIFTKSDYKWGIIWKIDAQKYYLKNYNYSGFSSTDMPFPGMWTIHRTDEKYMRYA